MRNTFPNDLYFVILLTGRVYGFNSSLLPNINSCCFTQHRVQFVANYFCNKVTVCLLGGTNQVLFGDL
jgi:hypothetical protein